MPDLSVGFYVLGFTAVRDRIRLLEAVASAYVPLCETWVELGLSAKGTRQDAYIEWAVARLRYGTVAINCLPGLGWGLTVSPWGSFPGNAPWDIQSGNGFVHNPYMF